MSAISGVGQGLSAYFQSLSVSNPAAASSAPVTDPSNATAAASVAAASIAADSSAGQGQEVSGHHHHHGGHGGGGGALFKNIQAAVSSALQSAQSDNSADPNQVVEDAIAKVLQQKGGQSSSATGTTGTDPNGNGATQAAAPSDGTTNSARQSFFQTLKSYGIDPQQFCSDFLAAVKDAQNGQANVATALQSIPPGTTVDTTA